jgi:hypothetical protein
MKLCIQDPASAATYLIPEDALTTFRSDPDVTGEAIDVLFVIPTDDVIQELPASRLSDSQTPSVQIVDPDGNRNWVLSHQDLQEFRASAPPADGEDVVWFAMPSARDLLAAVPVFRKALVQFSS